MRINSTRCLGAAQRTTLVSVLFVLAGVALVALYFRPAGNRSQSSATSKLAASQMQVLESAEQQRRALAEAKLRYVVDKGDEVLAATDQLAEEIKLWHQEVQSLLRSEQGRLIAADSDRVKRFAAMFNVDCPEPAYVERQRTRVKSLLDPLRKLLKGKAPPANPDEALEAQLNRELESTNQHITALQEGRTRAAAILAEAQRAGDEPATLTLEEKVAEIEEHYANLRTQELACARDEAEEQNRRRMADLEKRKLTELGEAERKRRQAELEAQRAREEAQAQATRERAKHDALITLAKSRDIQGRYGPFLAKGRYSFAQDQVLATASFRASYKALKQKWILSDRSTFALAATGNNCQLSDGRRAWFSKNDRPIWPSYPRTDAQWRVVTERFEEFRKLAPIWRDMGMLRP